MGKHNQRNRLGFCLIGLVMGALVAAPPSLAQDTSGEPPAEAESDPEQIATTGEKDSEAGEPEDGAPAEQETAQTEAGEEAESKESGEAPSAEPAEPNGASNTDPGAEDMQPDALPGSGAPADGFSDPVNTIPGAVPARARDPMSGADEPLEPADGYGVAEDGEVDIDEDVDTKDPLEGMNRVFFKFNDFLDKLIVKPAAQLYRFILPDYVEDRVRNVVNNADTPVILANDILQWKWDRAWNTTSRFFINTTLGVGGIWDVASSFGIDRHHEDFGQTLCVWGVNEWVYLYLPFVGPTNPRDLAGKVVDRYFDPLTYYADVVQQIDLSDGVTVRWNVDRAGMAQLSLTGADLLDLRARNIETLNEIERTSIDFYTAIRSLYRQSRENACNDGQVEFEDLPELDEFE